MKKTILFTTTALLAVASFAAMADHNGKDNGQMMMKEKDANGDGVISKEEFLAHAEKRFGDMDTDKDGKLTKEELKGHSAEMKEKRENMKEKMKDNVKDKVKEKHMKAKNGKDSAPAGSENKPSE